MAISRSGESGLTFIGLLILLGLIGFFTLLVLKIGPIYLDHYKVKMSLEGLRSDPDLASRSKEEVMRSLQKRWDIDMVDSVTKDDVTITKDINQINVRVAYDVAKPLFGNLDVLVHFDDSIEVSAR